MKSRFPGPTSRGSDFVAESVASHHTPEARLVCSSQDMTSGDEGRHGLGEGKRESVFSGDRDPLLQDKESWGWMVLMVALTR